MTEYTLNSKKSFLPELEIPETTKRMENLQKVVNGLVIMFHEGRRARPSSIPGVQTTRVFDEETLGGHVMLSKFAMIFGI